MKIKLLKYVLVMLLLGTGTFAQAQKVVTGEVTEQVGSAVETLIGVNVNIMNAQNRSVGGTVTDINGTYRLQVPDNEKELYLVFSYMGMKSFRVKYTGQAVQNVRMESSSVDLQEVSITGRRIVRNDMGIGQREAVTATQKIKMDDVIANTPIVSVEEALQGQLSGVDVVLGGGDPGARSSIRIRGTSTLNASSEPLIVIDGVPYPANINEDFDFATANDEDLGALLNLSPADIEDIEVLKDAAATAIWGTEGANGVLVIKTKRGTPGRKTTFSFTSKFSTKIEPKTIPMLNGMDYTGLMQEAIWNSANYIGMGTTTNKYLRLLYDTPEIGNNPRWGYYDEYNQDTDWLEEVRRTGMISDNSFSMSGGGEKATYRFSLGYVNDQGTTIGSSMSRLNTGLVVDYQFSDKLRFSTDFAYSQSDKDIAWSAKEGNIRSEAFTKMPNKSPYWIDENGNRTSQYFSYQTADFEGAFEVKDDVPNNYNPVAMAHESINNSMQRESDIKFRINYEILPGFTYNAWAALGMRTTKNRKFLPQVATGVVWTNTFANQRADATSDQMTLQTENKLMFNKNWNDNMHSLIATAVFRTSQTQKASYSSSTAGNPSPGLSDPSAGSAAVKIDSGTSEVRSLTAIGLLNYMLLNYRYGIQGSITMDSKSSIGNANRIAYFPAGGITWNAQNEPFLEDIGWLDEAKIRLGMGQTGRAPGGASLYLGAFSALGEYMDMPAIQPVRMQLDRLKWETSTEYNLGVDFGFLDGNLRFTFDYYRKYTKDLLQEDLELPTSTGYAKIKYFNSGKMSGEGYEFRTDVILYNKNDWTVSAYLNTSRNVSEVTELPVNMTQENYTFGNEKYAIRIEEGRPFGAFYGYRYKGVYKDKNATYARDKEGQIMNDVQGIPIIMRNGTAQVCPGDAIYEDINHDGVINEYDIVYLGNYMPVVMGGAGITVKWKRLSLSTTFLGRFGQKIINSTRMKNEAMYGTDNQSTAVLHRWRKEGDVTDIPRALYNEGYNYLGSDRFVEDASYVRLRSLSLNYALPPSICSHLGINTMSVYLTGYNLFIWTGYNGQDPEVSIPNNGKKLAMDGANSPISKQFACGISLNF